MLQRSGANIHEGFEVTKKMNLAGKILADSNHVSVKMCDEKLC